MKVALRNNETGEVRVHNDDTNTRWLDEEGSPSFWWTEGDRACDCSRAGCFYDFGLAADAYDCGFSKFSIAWVEDNDSTRHQEG